MVLATRKGTERYLDMSDVTVEEELIQIFASASNSRNCQIVIGYYGWDDGRVHTLAEVGARFGMTRERTRQICAKAFKRQEPSRIPAPAMERTLAFIETRVPCPVESLEQQMRQAGLTRVGLGLEHIETGASLLGRSVPFAVVPVGHGRLAVGRGLEPVPAAAMEAARKEVFYRGIANVGQIVEDLAGRFPNPVPSAMVTETLQLMDQFCWLDRAAGWFRFRDIRKHGLPKAIEKVMAVATRLRIADLKTAVTRNRRAWKFLPPEAVLLEFCRQMPGIRVERDMVVADPVRDWRRVLTGIEARLVEILSEHGPAMDRGSLEDRCLARGMNRFSYQAFLACSPVVAQYGHGVYGLVGAEISPQTAESMWARHRTDRPPARVLDGYGRTDDDRVWLRYRLSKAASSYAVVTVPAPLKGMIVGKFDLISGDGRRVGSLTAKNGRAWGLGAYLRRQETRIDDHVVVTLDLEKREALIVIGGR